MADESHIEKGIFVPYTWKYTRARSHVQKWNVWLFPDLFEINGHVCISDESTDETAVSMENQVKRFENIQSKR